MIITVPERGSTFVTDAEWQRLSKQKQFWRLVDSRVLRVELRPAGCALLGHCYVGRAVIGDYVIQAAEKVEGAFAALVNALSVSDAKVFKVPSPVSGEDYTLAILASAFVDAARRYLSAGKLAQYTQVAQRSAIVSGRLDVPGTAKLRARGMFHQVACLRSVLSADLPANRAVYAALLAVERLAYSYPIPGADVAAARVLRVTLSECMAGAHFSSPTQLSNAATNAIHTYAYRADLADTLSLATAVLDAVGFGGANSWADTVARSWFVNLETLFERAVRRQFARVLTAASVSRPRLRPSLFTSIENHYRANPDIVVQANGEVLAVADAKYKSLDGLPTSSDMFELVAHAATYGAAHGILVFPTEGEARMRALGEAATGCSIWIIEVPLTRFESTLTSMLTEIAPQLSGH